MNNLTKHIILLFLCALTNLTYAQDNTIKKSTQKIIIGGKRYIIHKVEEGHTLYAISKLYNVRIEDLLKANNREKPEISKGEFLKIPISNSNVRLSEIYSKKDHSYLYHTVAKGETLYSISKKFSISIEDLKKHNPGLSNSLKLGQRINIPRLDQISQRKQQKPKAKKKIFLYNVKQGDTEYSISNKFSLKIKKFRKLNPQLKGRSLQIGEWVNIPKYLVPESIIKKAEQEEKKELEKSKKQKTDTVAIHQIENNQYQNQVSYTDNQEDEKEIVEQINLLNKKDVKIAMFLPLYLKKNDSIQNNYKKIHGKQRSFSSKIIYGKSKDFLRFYQGVMTAVDTLINQGYSVDLDVFDTERSNFIVRRRLLEITDKDYDFIIGPVYPNTFDIVSEFAAQKEIPIISPLAGKSNNIDTNPYIIQLNLSTKSLCGKLSNYVCSDYQKKNLIIVHPENYKHLSESDLVTNIEQKLFEDGDFWKNEEAGFQKIAFDNKIITNLKHTLKDSCENLILIPSSKQSTVENIITNLNVMAQDYDIRVVGFPIWQRFNSIEPDIFFNIKLSVYSPYYINYQDQRVEVFLNKFREKYSCEPTDFSFRGYDMFNYFTRFVCKYGKEALKQLPKYNHNGLQSNFIFERISENGGFENIGGYLINYNKDFKISHTNSNKILSEVEDNNI
ncbi:MAG: LysM peptidoglycan-binding domain-containing protein [Marinifilaceae bacterium]|jgi:LysM repeat protein|nr:LysM peptidoglycan-binding domain-containing protein [Marinifilaceae bacterium]